MTIRIYSIAETVLKDIGLKFKKDYGFRVSKQAALKYCVMTTDVRYIKKIDVNLRHELPTTSIGVDDDVLAHIQSIKTIEPFKYYTDTDIISAIVLHVGAILALR